MVIRSLYWKIILSLVLFILIIGLTNGLVLLNHIDQLHQLLFGKGWPEMAGLLARSLESDLTSSPQQSARNLLLEKAQPSSAGMLLWCSPDGQITDLFGNPIKLSNSLCQTIQRQTGIRISAGSQRPIPHLWLRHFDWLSPLGAAVVKKNGQVLGAVIVTPPTRTAADLQKMHPENALLRLAWLMIAIAVAALVLYHPLKRRIRQLETGVAAIAAGNFSFRIPPQGGDELGQLSKQFNKMAGELESMRDSLQDENSRRKRLTQNIVHDLGTPLTSIRGYVETLQMENSQFSAEQRHYLQIVENETLRLDRLIRDLTELSQLDALAIRLQPEQIELEALFDQLIQRYRPSADKQQIMLEKYLDPPSLSITSDLRRLDQILDNLLSNAIRVTPAGGGIRIEGHNSGGQLEIVVADTGPGIAPEHINQIFDRFYRVDGARSADIGGSGLGLAIVKEVSHLLSGSIRVESRIGQGARFILTLPFSV